MSSNNQQSDQYLSNSIARLLQQQAQKSNGSGQGNGYQLQPAQPPNLHNIYQQNQNQFPPLHTPATSERGQLSSLLSTYLQQAVAPEGSAPPSLRQAPAPYQAEVGAHALQPQVQANPELQALSASSLSQQILASAQILSTLDPSLAVAVALASQMFSFQPPRAAPQQEQQLCQGQFGPGHVQSQTQCNVQLLNQQTSNNHRGLSSGNNASVLQAPVPTQGVSQAPVISQNLSCSQIHVTDADSFLNQRTSSNPLGLSSQNNASASQPPVPAQDASRASVMSQKLTGNQIQVPDAASFGNPRPSNYSDPSRENAERSTKASSNIDPVTNMANVSTDIASVSLSARALSSSSASSSRELCKSQWSPKKTETKRKKQTAAEVMASALPKDVSKDWTLEQLEAHVQQLLATSQPIPRPIAMLLASARRKQEKSDAKKLANRRSAFSSRMKKKAMIELMAQTNLRLKRESIVLNFLPDPVIAINVDGLISFANRQTERVLKYKVEELVGANINTFVDRDSRKQLHKMIKDLVCAEEQAAMAVTEEVTGSEGESSVKRTTDDEGNGGKSSSSEPNNSGSNTLSRSANQTMTGQNSLLLEVKLHPGKDNSNSLADQLSKKPASKRKHKSPSEETRKAQDHDLPPKKAKFNVDDDNGESATANNTEVKLPSLHYHMGEGKIPDAVQTASTSKTSSWQSLSVDSSLSNAKGLTSSDSGYKQESNESSLSTSSNTSDDATQRKAYTRSLPLAPTCNILLVRHDRSTVWCELTASIRTRSSSDEFDENAADICIEEDFSQEESKELLICVRPIIEGDRKLRDDPK